MSRLANPEGGLHSATVTTVTRLEPPDVGKGDGRCRHVGGRAHRRSQRSHRPVARHHAPRRHHPCRRREARRGGRPGPPPRDPLRLLRRLERGRRPRRRGRAARVGAGCGGHLPLQRAGAGDRGSDRTRRLRAGPPARAVRSRGHELRSGGLRVGAADGGGVHRDSDRDQRAGRDRDPRHVERAVRSGVRRRGRGRGRAARVPAVEHRRDPAPGARQRLGAPPHARAARP